MLKSLYSGVSGMRSFQTKMDVIANNIANVNTTGFKAGNVRFQDMLSQTIGNAQTPTTNGLGGVNPQQIGLGVKVGSIDMNMTGGSLQPTNRALDFAFEGEGFFMVTADNGVTVNYTRDGAFYKDSDGNLVNSNGARILGYTTGDDRFLRWDDNNSALYTDVDPESEGEPLTLRTLRVPDRVNLLDEAGNPVEVDGEFVYLDLESFNIDGSGNIIGNYSNGEESVTALLGQVGVATFTNPSGLEKAGNNNYIQSNNSGDPLVGLAGDPGKGIIQQGYLEMSNVDLATEFTEMIITSRAYQANSRSITTSDEMLQELINLKR